MGSSSRPFLSVVVCTRDRGSAVAQTVTSLLGNSYPAYEVLVVNQSRTDDTAQSLTALGRDGRLRSLRSCEAGLSRARNLGVCESKGQIIAFTDDDCDVPENWLEEVAAAFEVDRRIQLVFGSVIPAPHEPSEGLIPSYELREPFVARTVRDKKRADGMGACMALRRSTWDALGGFDPCLGAGAPLRSAEENDFALRVLLAGFWVYETPAVRVLHRGLRPRQAHDALAANYLFGTGAMFAKHFRLGHRGIVPLLSLIFLRWVFERPLVSYSTSPRRLLRLTAFCRGWIEGMRTPLDRATGLYGLPSPVGPGLGGAR